MIRGQSRSYKIEILRVLCVSVASYVFASINVRSPARN